MCVSSWLQAPFKQSFFRGVFFSRPLQLLHYNRGRLKFPHGDTIKACKTTFCSILFASVLYLLLCSILLFYKIRASIYLFYSLFYSIFYLVAYSLKPIQENCAVLNWVIINWVIKTKSRPIDYVGTLDELSLQCLLKSKVQYIAFRPRLYKLNLLHDRLFLDLSFLRCCFKANCAALRFGL